MHIWPPTTSNLLCSVPGLEVHRNVSRGRFCFSLSGAQRSAFTHAFVDVSIQNPKKPCKTFPCAPRARTITNANKCSRFNTSCFGNFICRHLKIFTHPLIVEQRNTIQRSGQHVRSQWTCSVSIAVQFFINRILQNPLDCTSKLYFADNELYRSN